jgi:hypothetical protein
MGKWLRRVGIALLCSLFAGFAFGTCLRQRAERPTIYMGALGGSSRAPASGLRPRAARRSGAESIALAPALPLDVRDSGAAVLDAREHEEQIREAVQVAQRQR